MIFFSIVLYFFIFVQAQQNYQIKKKIKTIILKNMLDILFSIVTLVYFTQTTTKPDSCYYSSLIYNIMHILCNSIIMIPMFPKLRQIDSLSKLRREYLKVIVVPKYTIIAYAVAMLVLGLCCLQSIVTQVFKWQNYGYLFTIFCLIGGSLTRVADFVQLRYGETTFFLVETYKFFCLIIATLMFGVSANEPNINIYILSMSWTFFIYRSKQSLSTKIALYFMIFFDLAIIIVAMITLSKLKNNYSQNASVDTKLTFIFSLIFYGLLFLLEVYDWIKIYNNQYQNNNYEYTKDMYAILQVIKQKNVSPLQKQWTQCSICLESISCESKRIVLECGHFYHFQCLEEWVFINFNCPMCRKNLVQFEGLCSEVQVV